MKAKLYSLTLSHPSRAARLMLELKGIDHEVVELLPGSHPLRLRATGFSAGTVPALTVDGERIQGSLRISRFLDGLVAEPPLYPADPERRREVERAEAWGEEVLQPIPRRVFRWGTARSREVRRWLAELSGIPMPAVAAALNAPMARYFVRRSDASEERVGADLAALPGILDRVDGLIAAGTIGGASINAADCQIASTVRVLLAYEDLAPILEHRPAAELAMRLFASYPSPIPLPLPSAWLPALTVPWRTFAPHGRETPKERAMRRAGQR